MSKPFVVFGATGNQGGSVANYVLDDPVLSKQYSVRAVTRNPSSPAAQALKSKGADVFQVDLDDEASIETVLTGADTVFALTNTDIYNENNRKVEERHAKTLVDTCVKLGVKYIIWSSLSHPIKISNGALTQVDHFDVKAEAEQYIRSQPIKSAHFAPASFMQNLLGYQRPQPQGDGTYFIPGILNHDTELPLIDIRDTGKWVGAVLGEPDKYSGAFFAAATRLYTMPEMAETVSKVTGKKVVYKKISDEEFKTTWPPTFVNQAYEMFVLFRQYGYYGKDQKEKVDWAVKQARGELSDLEKFLRDINYTVEG